jgi:RHS repeat-associated protein
MVGAVAMRCLQSFRAEVRKARIIGLALIGTIAALTPVAVLAQTVSQAPQVTIQEADRILQSRVPAMSPSAALPVAPTQQQGISRQAMSQSSVAGCASSPTLAVEIVTLASSLKCNVDLIFEYVYDNIEYEPLFGSNKGALGTLLDQRGDDIDQAQLFVALLNAAGITQTSFQYGYITLTGPTAQVCSTTGTTPPVASAPGWLGVKNDLFAIGNLLGNGGIPLGAGLYNADGTVICLQVAHVWVQVTLGGVNYAFDPSFKQHTVLTGLTNLGGILGYTQSQFLAAAAGTIDSVSISNINRAAVRSNLTAYANNLIGYIKGNNPAWTLANVVGGKSIIPLTGSPIRQTSLPYFSTKQPPGFPQNWGASVPNAFRPCIAITMPITGVSPTTCANAAPNPATGCATQTATAGPKTIVLYPDETYGQRITVFSISDPNHAGNVIPTLLVNGAAPTTGVNTGTSAAPGGSWAINVAITHPYAAFTAPNQCDNLSVAVGGSYLIGAGWGQVGRGMVQKHRQLLAQALAVPNANPASEAVLGESLAVISYNWLAENAAQQQLGDALGQATTQYHHGVGITAQTEILSTGDEGPYVDLPMNAVSVGQQTCWPQTSCPFPSPILPLALTESGSSSSLESAVLEQTQAPTPNIEAASTVRLVDENAGTGAKTFFADGTTSAGLMAYFNNIRPNLTSSYKAADLSFIDHSISTNGLSTGSPAGYQVLAPANGNITVGLWHGAGYTAISQTSTVFTCIQKISGGLSGGFTGTPVFTSDVNFNTAVTNPTPPAAPAVPALMNSAPAPANPSIFDPIDAISGANMYSHTDLAIGSGAFPYALPFGRNYQSSSNLSDIGLGNGWTHSYSLSARADSDPYEGLGVGSPIRSAAAILSSSDEGTGAGSPIRAAVAIAAIYVSQNLLSATNSAQSLTVAWMVNHWLTDQLTGNAAFVSWPDTTEEFTFLPHADNAASIAYSAPLGSGVQLTGAGTGTGDPTSYRYKSKDGVVLNFAPTAAGGSVLPISSWVYPNGVHVNFTYNSSGNLTAVANNLGRQLSLSYSASPAHISSVSDGARSMNYSYAGAAANTSGDNLASASDPLGNRTTFAYDNANRLTQIFYPNAPGSAYVTNVYDSLGRVAQQTNANGQSSALYFAGSRTEFIDAAGARHVTYQTPHGKITKDVWVLNSAVVDVFNDTAQSNGNVNVAANQYDGQDRLVLATAPEGGEVAYAYSPDLNQNVTSITRTAKPGSSLAPLTTTQTYDPIYNKPTSITDPRGLVTTMSYDPATGNLLSTVADQGGSGHFNATSRFAYNGVGQPTSSIDPRGVLTNFTYDSFGDLTSTIRDVGGASNLNQTTLSAYNSFGDVVKTTDPNGNVSTAAYDLDRRPTAAVSPASAAAAGPVTTSFAYDPIGQLLQTQQSANGSILRTTKTSYTPTGKPATTTDANGNVSRFAYDLVDRLMSATDPVGRVTTYAYDAMSRQLSISNPAVQIGALVSQTYTPDGFIGSFSDAAPNTTGFAYDGFDRLSTTTWPNASTEILTYDANGNVLTRKTRAGATIAYTYDTLNRLSTKTPPSPAPVVTYAYDLANHLIGVGDTSAAIVKPSTAATYVAHYTYDALNRPTNISWLPAPVQTAPSASSSAGFTFAYDATNRRTNQTATDNSWWKYPPNTAGVTSYTANNLNQYTAVGSGHPTYDGNGNLTYDGHFTYCYDAESRLTSVLSAGTCAAPTMTIAAYASDAQGRRKSKTVGATTTVYVTDADNREVLEYSGTGALQTWYAFGLGPDGALNQMNIAAGTRATLIPDVIGSTVGSLDSGGTLIKFGYQTFGENPSLTSGGYRYTGRRLDPETLASASQPSGLYYYRARTYSPTWGRFLQPDPSGYPAGPNLYAYVNNDPLNNVDPSGLVVEQAGSAVYGAVRNGASSAYNNLLAQPVNDIGQLLNNPSDIPNAIAGVAPGIAPVAAELPQAVSAMVRAVIALGSAPPQPTMGDLTPSEIRQIQSVVNQAGRGSRLRCQGRSTNGQRYRLCSSSVQSPVFRRAGGATTWNRS